ncbi:hypothetical protein GCM10022254_37830 [Actinomadura meridiana]|uniref:Uncharacterized protein n=1 Tax=Actinomadura meridiana TaxID=559626 RepID=A0ABP8C5D2_9ACTN
MRTAPWKHENRVVIGIGFEGTPEPSRRSAGAPTTCETSCWNRWDGTTGPGMERIRA